MELLKVKEGEENNRIDAYISSKTDISRVTVQRLIKEGNVLVNNKEVKASYKTTRNTTRNHI